MESSSRLSSGPLSKPVNLIEHPLSHPFLPPRIHFPPLSLLLRSSLDRNCYPQLFSLKLKWSSSLSWHKKKKKKKKKKKFQCVFHSTNCSWKRLNFPYYLHLTQPRRISVNSWDSIKKEKIEINSKKDSFKFDSQKKLGPRNRFTEGWSFLLVFPN